MPWWRAARYHSASPGLVVGGDFYDVYELEGGRVGLLLGDGAAVEVRGVLEARPWQNAAAPFAVADVRPLGGGSTLRCRGTIRVKLREAGASPGAGVPLVGRGRWWAQPAEGRWPQPPERAGVLSRHAALTAGAQTPNCARTRRVQRPPRSGRTAPIGDGSRAAG